MSRIKLTMPSWLAKTKNIKGEEINKKINIVCEILKETEKALLVNYLGINYWIPLSQIEFEKTGGTIMLSFDVYNPSYMGIDKVLGYDYDEEELIVQDVIDNKIRRHRTKFDEPLFSNLEKYKDVTINDCYILMDKMFKEGFPKKMFSPNKDEFKFLFKA